MNLIILRFGFCFHRVIVRSLIWRFDGFSSRGGSTLAREGNKATSIDEQDFRMFLCLHTYCHSIVLNMYKHYIYIYVELVIWYVYRCFFLFTHVWHIEINVRAMKYRQIIYVSVVSLYVSHIIIWCIYDMDAC